MDIDMKRLRNGEPVTCTLCGKGLLKPEFGAPPDKASQFKCSHCAEKLIFHFRASKPSE